jgi:predicted membrane protein
MSQSSASYDKRFWLGLIFVIIGSVILLDNFDVFPYLHIPRYLISWKTFLILLGFYFLFGKKKTEAGIIMIAIGGVFLLQDMHFFRFRDIWHIFWPGLLIAVGLSLILRRNRDKEFWSGEKKSSSNFLDDFIMLGGRESTIDSQEFRGGKITSIMGGAELDLRNAQLSKEQNVLDLFVLFGGIELVVPPDWTVHVEVVSIFGGFSDKRVLPLKVVPNPEQVITVKGTVLFGGGEIKVAK